MSLQRRAGRDAAQVRSSRSGAAASDDGARRWTSGLVVYMRLLACIWVVQGLVQWRRILEAPESPLDTASVEQGAAMIFFAVLDPVAAVGLWLATPWGGIIWIFAAAAQMIAAVTVHNLYSPLWIGVDALLLGLYALLVWRATRPAQSRA